MAGISTHVLDISKGQPAVQVLISIYQLCEDQWLLISQGVTDAQGRLQFTSKLTPGMYRLNFGINDYFQANQTPSIFPLVEVVFEVKNSDHYHVPLLISPYGYSTYRGC